MHEPTPRPDWEDLPDGRNRRKKRKAAKPEPTTAELFERREKFTRNVVIGERLTHVMYGFLLAYIISMVLFDDIDGTTRLTRAFAGALVLIAWTLLLLSRREFRRARHKWLEAATAVRVLGEITSGYTWGESMIVVCYSRDDVAQVARDVAHHDKVKGVYPAGMPSWVEGESDG